MTQRRLEQQVLLIGGQSGVGKSTAARAVGLRLGISWLSVDDLRLALQRCRAALPDKKDWEALYFFETTPNVRHLAPEKMRDALIALGEAISPAIEVVVESHVDQASPIIIEGDGILPSLLARPPIFRRAESLRTVFLVEPDEGSILANIHARGRGISGWAESELRAEARAKWLHGQWLAEEARRCGIPIMEPQPWSTLADRICGLLPCWKAARSQTFTEDEGDHDA